MAPISSPFLSIFIFLLRFCNWQHYWCCVTREAVPSQPTHVGPFTAQVFTLLRLFAPKLEDPDTVLTFPPLIKPVLESFADREKHLG